MADAVATQIIQDYDARAIIKFTNISDGTGESAVLKVDVSTLAVNSNGGAACTSVVIERIWAMTDGMGVDVLWDATTDVLCAHIPQNEMYEADFMAFGGLTNNSGTGKTGDILFTTTGHTSGDRYTIVLQLRKAY
jgi:hypothetical protein